MLVPSKLFKIPALSVILFAVSTAGCLQAEDEKKSQATNPAMQQHMTNPMMGMANPMMNPMMGMMNPMMGMMNPMMGMANPMMNPMMGMMNPMMGMANPMMNPMMGTMNPMMGMTNPMMNPMGQMSGGQMMDPKQYKQMFDQWTEMMKNYAPQTQTQQQK